MKKKHYLASCSLPHQLIAICGRYETLYEPVTERERERFATAEEEVTCRHCLKRLRDLRERRDQRWAR